MRILPLVAWLLPLLVLAGCGDPVVVDVGGRNMKQLAEGTRAQRLQALVQIPGFKYVPAKCEAAVLEFLADPDAAVRTTAAKALQYASAETQSHLEPAVVKAFDVEADAGVKQQLKIALDVIRGVIQSPDNNPMPLEPPPPVVPPTPASGQPAPAR